jgi:hypothetical protein
MTTLDNNNVFLKEDNLIRSHVKIEQIELQEINPNDQRELKMDRDNAEMNFENNDTKLNKDTERKDGSNLNAPIEDIQLNRTTRYWFFCLVMSINLLINLENGTIPAATIHLKEDLKIDDEGLGTLGSLVFAGSLIGSVIVMYIINKINRKWFFIMTLFFNGLGMFTFTLTNNIGFLYFNRILFGVFEVCNYINFLVICCHLLPSMG